MLLCATICAQAQQNKASSCSLDDFAKQVFGESASFTPRDYLSKIKVYDADSTHVTGSLTKDFAVLAKALSSEANITGIVGLWGGLKVEANDIVVIDDDSKFSYGTPDESGVYDEKFYVYDDYKSDIYKPHSLSAGCRAKFIYRFSKQATIYFSINEHEYDCNEEDADFYVIPYGNCKIEDDNNIDVTIRRFRQIAKYEVSNIPSLLFEKKSLLSIKIEALDVDGKVVPIVNKLESQWQIDENTGIATFTPILPYEFKGSWSSRKYFYLDDYIKAVEANGVSLAIDINNKSVVTSLNDVKQAAPRVTAIDGGIAISGCDDCGVDVYSIDGKKVYSGHDSQVCLPGGIYIVRVDGKAVKVVVK